jgi:hypothetical protein
LLQNCCYTLEEGRGNGKYEEKLSKSCFGLSTFFEMLENNRK